MDLKQRVADAIADHCTHAGDACFDSVTGCARCDQILDSVMAVLPAEATRDTEEVDEEEAAIANLTAGTPMPAVSTKPPALTVRVTNLPEVTDLLNEIRRYGEFTKGKKIQAIKQIRRTESLSLTDAKNLVEALELVARERFLTQDNLPF